MSATPRRAALVVFVVGGTLVAAATAATAAPAATGEPTTLQVEGTQTPVTPEL